MNPQIERIQKAIEPLRQQIIHHPMYSAIEQIEDLHTFMESHVFAVWDFISLLKTLQTHLTCTTVPWFPKGAPTTRYLINEIVVGEESDSDGRGNRASHFELYLEAMKQCGANLHPIQTFISSLQQEKDFPTAFHKASVPEAARRFVEFTFAVIQNHQPHVQAAVFTFGREDLIPTMFLSIVNDLQDRLEDDRLALLKYYLKRHIELDGAHHSHLTLEMTTQLCGSNELLWREAEQAVLIALQQRIDLWDGVHAQLLKKSAFQK